MNDLISPKYLMKLIKSVHDEIWKEFPSYKEARLYINRWHTEVQEWNNYWENFAIVYKANNEIDLLPTLHNMSSEDILKMAIDLGVDTPDFIPSIPTFKNELKADYKTAYDTFTKAFKQIESDPSTAIGLANSALESIIKEILKDQRLGVKLKGNETLYNLTINLIREFNKADKNHPEEIKTIANSLISVNQSIEKLRSEKTAFHGKTDGDYVVTDPIYTYFIVNCVTTVGLYLTSYYKSIYPKVTAQNNAPEDDDLPF